MPELIAEATRWRVVLPVGVLKGITEADAYRLAAEHNVRPDRAMVRLYADGTEELGPWSPAPMLPRRLRTQAEREERWQATADTRPGYATWPDSPPGSPCWWARASEQPPTRSAPGSDPITDAAAAVGRVLTEQLPALGEALADLAPRRRWWHRYTRRNP